MVKERRGVLFGLMLSFVLLMNVSVLHAQVAPQSVDNVGIYDFIDELANSGLINVNSAIKPYSRLFIAKKLEEAYDQKDLLNIRQLKELEFYLKDFRKELPLEDDNEMSLFLWNIGSSQKGLIDTKSQRLDLFYYKDNLFSLTINPIIGGEVLKNNESVTYWKNGFEARAYIGKWAFWASLRDNHESELLGKPQYLTQRRGGHIKMGTDYSDMQGGISYAWRWGDISFRKDNFVWGNNYNGANIFSGRAPSFMYLDLHIKPTDWFEFNYVHGWLNSMVVDSARSYWVSNSYGDDYREKYHRKYMAANMYTFTPFKKFNISIGNSIVYDDVAANPAYLFPLFFYKSVDHSITSGIDNMNSQMFFDVSSRNIKNTHLYVTLFCDELSVSRFTKKDEWNFFSWKVGGEITNVPIDNLSLTVEYTYSYPLTFQHYVPTTTFQSNRYNLGHYLTDNAREWYVALGYKPFRATIILLYYLDAVRGPDYTSVGGPRVGNPPLESVEWSKRAYGLKVSGQVINDVYVWLGFEHSDIDGDQSLNPMFYYGSKNTLDLGVTVGF